MDVRGPTDRNGASSESSPLHGERIRHESAQDVLASKGPKVSVRITASELVQLVRQLKELPEVREDVVKETIVKMRDGQYATRESAEQTAEAIMRLSSDG